MWAGRLIQFAGAGLILVTLLDVFMTVLYARAGAELISHRISQAVGATFHWLAKLVPSRRHAILSFAGPTFLVALVTFWAMLLWLGFALITWPALGTSVKSTEGDTPTDFVTALSFSGNSMTTVGTPDMQTVTPFFRLLTVVDSLIGLGVITLTLTYFMQIYNALQDRNAFALQLHMGSGRTADAARVLAGLGHAGDFEGARDKLSMLADELVVIFESHHFYPSLHLFRFQEPHYAMPHVVVLLMDLATLIHVALDERQYASLIHSFAVTELWETGLYLLHDLGQVFLPDMPRDTGNVPRPEIVDTWRRRYFAAAKQLREAGLATMPDDAGADRYIALRAEWDPIPMAFGKYHQMTAEEIDPAGTRV